MSVQTQQIHRRKSSKEDANDSILISPPPSVEVTVPDDNEIPTVRIAAPPSRVRTQSTPLSPTSGGPYRSTFVPRPLNGHSLASPLRSSFAMNGHARTRSTSTPFSPVSPSPLSASFPAVVAPPGMQASRSASEVLDGQSAGAKHARRHSRMHSRNLSVFFPRPGSLPHTAISEDGGQEVEFPTDEEAPLVPSAGSSIYRRAPVTPLGQGFTFGQRPPSNLPTPELMTEPQSATSNSSSTSKRGHHHKHSLSHNFFSFLEPTVAQPEELHTQPTPTPMSPWGPISAIPPDSVAATAGLQMHSQSGFKVPAPRHQELPEVISPIGLASSVSQFVLGAYLWVIGQQVGSLSVTGLGYWVVFDAFGIALSCVIPGWLSSGDKKGERIRRSFGCVYFSRFMHGA